MDESRDEPAANERRYPAELEQPGLLRDGRSILVRPVMARDEERMLDFSRRLSRRTIAQRLLGPVPRFRREMLRYFVDVDYVNHLALVALLDDRLIATGRLIRIDDTDHAEVSFTVADEFQGLGLATMLLERLARAAPAIGVYVFEADVLATNAEMLRVFAASGYSTEFTVEGHLQHVVLGLDPRASALARISRKEHQATRQSLERLMRPRSIAVIGANRQRHLVGSQILENLIASGFPGPVHPVNPAAERIAGVPAVASVRDLPPPVDLAIVAVRADALAAVLRDCAEAGVGAAVVVTADYDTDDDAAQRASHADLVRFARAHGLRLVGPASMGVLSLHRGIAMNATFAPGRPPLGRVAMSSQSGTLGLAILDLANRAGLGFSGFVSIGTAADVSSNDLLEWWQDDPETSVVLLYLERFGDPRNFARIARAVGARKPIVAVNPGTDQAGGALLAQAGIIACATLDEMFDVALLLANQPVPDGDRVAIVTNAMDPGALTAAACAANGLVVSRLAPSTRDRLAAAGIGRLRADGVVDLRPAATPADYREAVTALLADPGVDALIVVFMPPLVSAVDEIGAAIGAGARESGTKPVAASFMSYSGLASQLREADRAIPSYVFPERAAAALGRAAAYGRWRREPAGVIVYPSGIDRKAARRIVADAGPGWLDQASSAALLRHYGISVAAAQGAAPAGGAPVRGILAVRAHPLVGPVVSFGLAGVFTELFDDLAVRVTPLTDRDARELLASLRAFPLLAGGAGHEPCDLAAIEDTLLRLSAMVEDLPAVHEVTIDPLLIGRPGEGAIAAEPRVRIQAGLSRGAIFLSESQWAGSDFQLPPRPEPGIALCGACRRLGACRLGLGREELLPDGSVVTELACGPENEGGPGVAHGGWTAGVFDEVTGHVPLLHGKLAVTGQLSVRYIKPVPIGRALRARAWTQRQEGHRWYVAGELTLASTGALLATGEAVMVLRDISHFARHQTWLAGQDAEAAARNPIGPGTE